MKYCLLCLFLFSCLILQAQKLCLDLDTVWVSNVVLENVYMDFQMSPQASNYQNRLHTKIWHAVCTGKVQAYFDEAMTIPVPKDTLDEFDDESNLTNKKITAGKSECQLKLLMCYSPNNYLYKTIPYALGLRVNARATDQKLVLWIPIEAIESSPNATPAEFEQEKQIKLYYTSIMATQQVKQPPILEPYQQEIQKQLAEGKFVNSKGDVLPQTELDKEPSSITVDTLITFDPETFAETRELIPYNNPKRPPHTDFGLALGIDETVKRLVYIHPPNYVQDYIECKSCNPPVYRSIDIYSLYRKPIRTEKH